MALADPPKIVKFTDFERVFTVGDVHGCYEEVQLLWASIEKELTDNDALVFIGDYVDRGPEIKKVLEFLVSIKDRPKTFFLKGNHEDMMLDYLADCREGGQWWTDPANGGKTTLTSFGAGERSFNRKLHRETILENGKGCLDFLENNLTEVLETDHHIFVHAGISPRTPLELQCLEDVLWIREDFIGSSFDCGKTVLFGHTGFKDVLVDLPLKIGLDTACVRGRQLSCVSFENKPLKTIEDLKIFQQAALDKYW